MNGEAGFQAQVLDLAESLGLVVLHLRAPAREGSSWAGWPDLIVIAPGGGIMFRELKMPGKQLRAAQRDWADILSGQDFATWHPADWHAGRVRAELLALAEPGGQDDEPGPHGPETPRERLWRLLAKAAQADTTANRPDSHAGPSRTAG